MDTEDFAHELESVGENIKTFVGTKRQRIELLERTLSDSTRLTRMLTDALIVTQNKQQEQQSLIDKLSYTLTELETKLARMTDDNS